MTAAMSAHAAPAAGRPTLVIRGTPYPVLLPKLSDPRLHLAAVITSLQVLGQVEFHFRVSIAQILIALLTCAVLEVGIAFRRQHVILWPASAMLTGNGVAFILRVPGHRPRRLVEHARLVDLRRHRRGVAALEVRDRVARRAHLQPVEHRPRPLLPDPRTRAAPSRSTSGGGRCRGGSGSRLAIIVAGGLLILSRLRLLVVAVGFWLAFAAGIGVLAASGHAMSARWHLGPITGIHFWSVLVTSPEILVFLFFMITDPKTAPAGRRARLAYAVSVGLLSALLIAPVRTEYATKVARAQLARDRLRGAAAARSCCRFACGSRGAASCSRRRRARGLRRRARHGEPAGALDGGDRARGERRRPAADHDRAVARRQLPARPADGATHHARPRRAASRSARTPIACGSGSSPARARTRRSPSPR